jgi:hypothetical protein
MGKFHDPAASRFRTYLLRVLVLMLAAAIAFYFVLERGQHIMRTNVLASASAAAKPLIDTLVPRQIATATFALG